jgi:DNA-binding response OmpR family regulator
MQQRVAVVDWTSPGAPAEAARLRKSGCLVIAVCDLSPRSVREALAAGADEVVSPALLPQALERRRISGREDVRASSERHEALVRRGRRWVRLDGLTSTELRLLECLLERPGAVLSRAQLTEALGVETVDKHAQTLRRKLGTLGRHLATVRGSGYRWR